MDPEKKASMLRNTADSLPLRRWGQPADMGQAIDFLLCSTFTTGVVLDVDGGHTIRQARDAHSAHAAPPLQGTTPARGRALRAHGMEWW